MIDNVYAGIVLYNPDLDRLYENIHHIKKQVREIVLVDNSTSSLDKSFLEEMGAIYISNAENKGIAFALNQICEWGMTRGYEYALLLDQDSIASDDLVEKELKHTGEEVSVVSPRIVYRNNEQFGEKREQGYEKVEWTITSGSMICLRIWKKLKGFDETLFIDGVDYDYGIRSNAAGYSVIRTFDTYLLQELGNLKCRRMFGRVIYVTNHSATRKYYMARNQIYLKYKLKQGNPWKTIMQYLIKVILYEDEKSNKIRHIFKGVRDGIRMKSKIQAGSD